MSFGRKTPDIPMYEEMKDTPYISNLRDLSQRGYEGYKENYNRVNTFSPETQANLNAQVNDVYRRAESDFDRQYRDTMQKYANANYGQFGTLNATPALYRTDMENLQQQRKLADLSYNKALYRDEVINNELNRRYKTLDMFNQMLEKGQTPYQQDLKNWDIRNQNLDREFQNQVARYNQKGNLGRFAGSVIDPFGIWGAAELLGPTYSNQITGNSSKLSGTKALNAILAATGLMGGAPTAALAGGSSSSTPWTSSFNQSVLPYLNSISNIGGDYGRQGFLSDGAGQLDWLNSGGFNII